MPLESGWRYTQTARRQVERDERPHLCSASKGKGMGKGENFRELEHVERSGKFALDQTQMNIDSRRSPLQGTSASEPSGAPA